jgi:methyltransferase family protein
MAGKAGDLMPALGHGTEPERFVVRVSEGHKFGAPVWQQPPGPGPVMACCPLPDPGHPLSCFHRGSASTGRDWRTSGRQWPGPAPNPDHSRARHLVPAACLVQADMTSLHLRPASLDAVVSFYALIYVPLADQQALFPRIRSWLRPGGYLLAITGAQHWTGTERYLGADMFWDHADTATYLDWLAAAQLTPIWHRHIPEGNAGHSLILARAS